MIIVDLPANVGWVPSRGVLTQSSASCTTLYMLSFADRASGTDALAKCLCMVSIIQSEKAKGFLTVIPQLRSGKDVDATPWP